MSHHTHTHESHGETGGAGEPQQLDDADVRAMFGRAHWDERYASSERVWSGNPNQRLVEQAAALTPSAPLDTALDVGCGEGADAIWLAERGWRVTGLDISQVALDKGRSHAAERGVADRTSWVLVDLLAGEPVPGRYGLVTASFFHLPEPGFTHSYRALADAVLPGGTLLVTAHHPDDAMAGARNPALARLMFGPEQVTALLDPTEWDVVVAEVQARPWHHPETGEPMDVDDTVVRAVRR